MFRYVLFDLDGTLTESAPGIINSVKYAFSHYGITDYDEKELESFVGPPLTDSFMRYCGFSAEKAAEAVEVYREYFREKGMFENSVYPGVRECLEKLKANGLRLGVATSKPKPFCDAILKRFGLFDFFEVIEGIPLDGEGMTKTEVISKAISAFGSPASAEIVMVGDRQYDVEGAADNGIACIGVLYGYGSRKELAEAYKVCRTPEEVGETVARG